MFWNHRVMRHVCNGEICYGIYEVYMDGDKLLNWTEEPVSPHYNETTDADWSLRKDFERQMEALNKPILDWKTGEEIE